MTSEPVQVTKGTDVGTLDRPSTITDLPTPTARLSEPSESVVPGDAAPEDVSGEDLDLDIDLEEGYVHVVSDGRPSKPRASREAPKERWPQEMQELVDRALPNLTEAQAWQLENLLRRYRDAFACEGDPLGHTDVAYHSVDTGNTKPVKVPVRRVPIGLKEEVTKQLDNMIEQGVIEPSNSLWSSPIVLVKKKDGTHRFCVDYR